MHQMHNKCPVIFLSLGPGDPELLTLKAVRCLKAADVVMVPATRDAQGLLKSRAADIIREWCADHRLTAFELPMLKDRKAVSDIYQKVYEEIIIRYDEGLRVVVAVEGDVSIYASIHYVMDRLQSEGIPVAQ